MISKNFNTRYMINQSVSILTIGDELLIGQIQDSNSTWLMDLLTSEGFNIIESRTIRDDKTAIVNTLRDLSHVSGLIVVTGGLGPTKDDCTKEAFAEFMRLPLVHNERQWQHIVSRYKTRQHLMSKLHISQALLPEGVELLDNPEGTALGITYENGTNAYVLLPGVPSEMKAIISAGGGLEWMKKWLPESDIYRKTFVTIGKSETWIAERIAEFDKQLPASLGIAYLPSISNVKIRLTYRRTEGEALRLEEFSLFAERLRLQLGEVVFADVDVTIEEYIGNLLRSKKKQLGTAESCTGGYLAHLLTRLPGASDYYKGSIIAYHRNIKKANLMVRGEDLEKYGAVSEEVVRQMAINVCKALDCDYGIAISGIAGPDGGSAEKPVGTIWIAVADNLGNYETKLLNLSLNRLNNIQHAASLSLNLLRNFLLD